MSQINASNFNNLNSSVYKIASTANVISSLSTEFQSASGNNTTQSEPIKQINIENIRAAINKLETTFSYNCCQSNCNSTSTKCQTTTCQYTTCQSVSTSCQSCQRYYYYGK